MDLHEYAKLVAELARFDEGPVGQQVFTSTKHLGRTFAFVAHNDSGYCAWTLAKCDNPFTSDMRRFKSFLWQRESLTTRLREMDEHARRQMELARKDMLAHAEAERVAVLAERRRTARAEQLLGLTHDIDCFQASILARLPLATLLNLPRVCRALRESTSARADWFRVVAVAMGKRWWERPEKAKNDKHNAAVKRFFGIPSEWVMSPILYDPTNGLQGYEEHARVAKLAKAYSALRNEVRLAIQYWRGKYRVLESEMKRVGHSLVEFAKELDFACERLRKAVNAVIEHHKTNTIKTTLPAMFWEDDLETWTKFGKGKTV